MFCPYCGNPCGNDHRFCYKCGGVLPILTEETTTEIPFSGEVAPAPAESGAEQPIYAYVEPAGSTAAAEVPAPKKGRLWPPILAMVVMVAIGLTAFFFTGRAPASEAPWFTVENGTLYFNEALYTGPDELAIPATVDGQTVTAIGEYAFSGCQRIASVVIPETVSEISAYAFSGCAGLRGIYIPATVETVGQYAFENCAQMEAIYVCSTLRSMGNGALDGCTGLRYILFDGSYAQWLALYNGAFTGDVELHAADGVYFAHP